MPCGEIKLKSFVLQVMKKKDSASLNRPRKRHAGAICQTPLKTRKASVWSFERSIDKDKYP